MKPASTINQTFEFYEVDPRTWLDRRPIADITDATVTFDGDAECFGNATMTSTSNHNGKYVRAYIVQKQLGRSVRDCIGTFLVQTASRSFDGKSAKFRLDAYMPLIELRYQVVPIGYYVPKGSNVTEVAERIIRDRCNAPVTGAACDAVLVDDFVADGASTWLELISELLAKAEHELTVDPTGRIVLSPVRDVSMLAPVARFTDGNSTIYPEIEDEDDLFEAYNVYSAVWSSDAGSLVATAYNMDEANPVSIPARGMEVQFRDDSPEIEESNDMETMRRRLDEYVVAKVRECSARQSTVRFSHGFMPNVHVHSAVELDSARIGLRARAGISSMSFDCSTGCKVTDTATYTNGAASRDRIEVTHDDVG